MISFSAGNANTRILVGFKDRKKFINLKKNKSSEKNILGTGCLAYVIQTLLNKLQIPFPIDGETTVCKIFGLFHIYTVCVDNLKEFCDIDKQYNELLLHFKIRWPAIKTIIIR